MVQNHTTFLVLFYELSAIKELVGRDIAVDELVYFRFNDKKECATAFALSRNKYQDISPYCHEIFGNISPQQRKGRNLVHILNENHVYTSSVAGFDTNEFGFAHNEFKGSYDDKLAALTKALAEAREEQRLKGTLVFSDLGLHHHSSHLGVNEDITNNLELGDVVLFVSNTTCDSKIVPVVAIRKNFRHLGEDIYIRNTTTLATIGDIIAQEFRCEKEYIEQCDLQTYFKIN